MNKLLMVEDDPVIGKGLKLSLELEGYQVAWAQNMKDAEVALQPGVDLVLLDLGLPDGSGLDLCKKIRSSGNLTPVVILTAQGDEDSVVQGLQSGANDYVRKPFGQKELIARIQNAIRGPRPRESQINFMDLVLSKDQRRVMSHGKEIDFNRREFDILCFLMESAEMVVTRDSILQKLNKEGEIFDRTVDSHLSHIRTKLRQAGVGSVQITSVYGIGYRLEKK
jgi:DNA-binding response OmpR family regulator